MNIDEMIKWLNEYIPGGSAIKVTELIVNDERWKTLTVDEKLTLVVMILGRIRI